MLRKLVVPTLLTVIISAALMVIVQGVDFFPTLAAQQAQAIDSLFLLLLSIAVAIFVLCMVFLLYSLVVFRRRPGDMQDAQPIEGSTSLEIAWTIIPLIIVVSLAIYSAGILVDITKASPDAELEVKVTGFQWAWRFEYPELGISTSRLVLPVNRPVVFRVTASDVIHSFWVPEFRVKIDAIPGMENRLRITPTKEGQYQVRCAEICGAGHAYMLAPVEVVEYAAFQEWAAAQAKPATVETPQPGVEAPKAEQGRQYAGQFACVACHSADGSSLVGPTWKGLFGSTRTFQDGTAAAADEDYLRSSILNPGAQIVQGFPDLMPKTFKDQLTEEQIQSMIEYIKSLK